MYGVNQYISTQGDYYNINNNIIILILKFNNNIIFRQFSTPLMKLSHSSLQLFMTLITQAGIVHFYAILAATWQFYIMICKY